MSRLTESKPDSVSVSSSSRSPPIITSGKLCLPPTVSSVIALSKEGIVSEQTALFSSA